jgi:hypothetical protein
VQGTLIRKGSHESFSPSMKTFAFGIIIAGLTTGYTVGASTSPIIAAAFPALISVLMTIFAFVFKDANEAIAKLLQKEPIDDATMCALLAIDRRTARAAPAAGVILICFFSSYLAGSLIGWKVRAVAVATLQRSLADEKKSARAARVLATPNMIPSGATVREATLRLKLAQLLLDQGYPPAFVTQIVALPLTVPSVPNPMTSTAPTESSSSVPIASVSIISSRPKESEPTRASEVRPEPANDELSLLEETVQRSLLSNNASPEDTRRAQELGLLGLSPAMSNAGKKSKRPRLWRTLLGLFSTIPQDSRSNFGSLERLVEIDGEGPLGLSIRESEAQSTFDPIAPFPRVERHRCRDAVRLPSDALPHPGSRLHPRATATTSCLLSPTQRSMQMRH